MGFSRPFPTFTILKTALSILKRTVMESGIAAAALAQKMTRKFIENAAPFPAALTPAPALTYRSSTNLL